MGTPFDFAQGDIRNNVLKMSFLNKVLYDNKKISFIMKTSALALIEAVSFYGGVHHKRYKCIAGNSS